MGDPTVEKGTELVADLGEVALDSLLSDGLLKDIPFLGSAVKIAHFARNISDRLFLRKVVAFLDALRQNRPDPQEFHDFRTKLEADRVFAHKLGETTALILDRLNDFEKPAILARLFAALMQERITFDQFRRLASALDIAFVLDLRELAERCGGPSKVSPDYLHLLVTSGLTMVSPTGSPVRSVFGEATVYHPVLVSPLGHIYMQAMGTVGTPGMSR